MKFADELRGIPGAQDSDVFLLMLERAAGRADRAVADAAAAARS